MNIRDVNAGSLGPDRMRSGSVEKAEEVGAPSQQAAEQSSGSKAAGDSVEISDSARAAQTEGDKYAAELSFAKRTLTEIPPLTESRALEIIKRVEEGYYSKPDNVRQIAEQLARDLGRQQAAPE